MDKLHLGALICSVGFSCLIAFALFSMSTTTINTIHNKCIERENRLQNQIDSLETTLNTFYKNKKDTILIQVNSQPIKIYNYECSTRH